MKVKILDTNNKETKSVTLPAQFNEPLRKDIVKRAVLALQSQRRKKYGAKPGAGMRYSSFLSKRRNNYKSTYGIGQSRTPRKILNRSGTRFFFVGATVPQTVGGREAHAPKAQKEWVQKINAKERKKAIRSALAATVDPQVVLQRGHKLPSTFPFVLDNVFEQVTKTSELSKALEKLGFEEELLRAQQSKIRAGAGKRRGRRKQTKKSFLFVVSKDCPLLKAAANIPGADVVPVNSLNAELLAPGSHPGRLTLFTDSAIEALNQHKLFCEIKKGEAQ